MANPVSVIGRTTRVRGRVTGAVDLEISGFVDGEIAVGGDVTVDAPGMVGAGIRGRRVVVRGAVKGDLVGDDSVSVEDGARVVGDVRAPRVAIAPGALVRGFVQAGEPNAGPAPRAQSAARAAATPAAKASPVAASRSTAVAVPPPPVTTSASTRPATGANATNAVQSPTAGPARRPPPPVVPALKKARGQIARRKER